MASISGRPSKRKIVIFSGGTAANSLVDVFNEVLERNECTLSYVIPISDNGGSSSELIRVFGGPGIGDVRSMIFSPHSRSPPLLLFYCESSFPTLWLRKGLSFLDSSWLGKLLLLFAQDKGVEFFFCALGGDFRLRFSFPIFYVVLFYIIDIIFS